MREIRQQAERIRTKLRELLPAVANALSPPDRENTDWEALGATSEEIRGFALDGLTRRLNIIGVPLVVALFGALRLARRRARTRQPYRPLAQAAA